MTQRRASVRRTLDVGRAGEAISRPGIDPRSWCSYAIADDDPRYLRVTRPGIYVDVTLQPSGTRIVALVGQAHSAPAGGDYRPIRRGDSLLVDIPEGDPNAGPVVLRRLPSEIDAVPDAINGRANDGSFGYDVVDADVEEQSTTGSWRRRAASVAALDGQANAGVLLGFAAVERVIRGDAHTNAHTTFLQAYATFLAAWQTALLPIATVPPAPPPTPAQVAAYGVAVQGAVEALQTALTAWIAAIPATLSNKVRTE